MILLLLISASFLNLVAGQLDATLGYFQSQYDQEAAKFGDDYMEGIEFTQQHYIDEAIGGEEFDFIVVGAGPAGCVITHRLSETRQIKVLLLEAGKEAPVLNDIPYLMPLFTLLKEYNYGYNLEKNKHFGWGLKKGIMPFPRGRGLGGTTILNTLLFTRGNRKDYDKIAEMGNQEWSWENVEPLFKAIENTRIEHQDFEERGQWGLLNCDEMKNRSLATTAFVESCQKNGLKYVDFNGRKQLGTSFSQVTIRNGLRLNAEKAYLRPIKKRPNLKILTESLVSKVLFDGNVATGVVYTRNGKSYTAKATKEVILCAGTFNSPQLLMVSGVGPEKKLVELGIPVVKNLPVGKWMYDHLAFFGCIFEADESVGPSIPAIIEMEALIANGTGNLEVGYAESQTFIQTKAADKKLLADRPDIELATFPGDFSADKGALLIHSFGISQEFYDQYFVHHENKNLFTVIIIDLHPKSKGRLTIKSPDVNDPPIIHYPFLNNEYDVKRFLEAINYTIEITKQEPLAKYNVRPVTTPFPRCKVYPQFSDKYWECVLRTLSVTVHHQVSTCRMGPENDPEAVVDQRGTVHGVKNLRVADPSILPISISAHTQVPSYMIGEKIAKDMKIKYLLNN